MPFDDSDDDDDLDRGPITDEDVLLELAKTRLRVCDDELQRLNHDGGFLLRIPLADVQSIELRAHFDPMCLIFLGIAAGLVAIALFVTSEYIIINCLLYLAALGLLALSCFGFIARSVMIRTLDGATKMNCDDAPDEGECFVISVRRLLRDAKGTAPRIAMHKPEPDTGFQR